MMVGMTRMSVNVILWRCKCAHDSMYAEGVKVPYLAPRRSPRVAARRNSGPRRIAPVKFLQYYRRQLGMSMLLTYAVRDSRAYEVSGPRLKLEAGAYCSANDALV